MPLSALRVKGRSPFTATVENFCIHSIAFDIDLASIAVRVVPDLIISDSPLILIRVAISLS